MKSLLGFFKANNILTSIALLLASNYSFSQNWNPLSSGTNGAVYACLIVPGVINDLYIAGSFTVAGGVSANRIARWNGSSWVSLGSGMDGTVHALAYFQGNIIAAGEFFNAGGVPANRIAKWDGTSWSPLALGTNDYVYSLTVYFNELRAGGRFTTAGGINVNKIARWNGSSWAEMGTGVNDEVYSLAIYGNDLIVGGKFTTAGGLNAARIAKWNSSWSTLGTGMDDGDVRALIVSNGKLYAGGRFTSIGGVTVNYVANWNGSNWSSLASGTNNAVYALYSSTSIGMIAVGGLFTIAGGMEANQVATWNGTNWGTLGNGMSGGNPSSVLCFTDYSAVLHAAGNFSSAGGLNANNAALWGSKPFAPVIISPTCGATGQSLTPLLVWSTVPNVSSYSLQVSLNPNFLTTVINLPSWTQSQYQVPGGILNNNTTYYWHVNANNGIGAGPFSTVCHFSTLITNISNYNNQIPGEFKLYQNFPNPFNPYTLIRFDIPAKNKNNNDNIILSLYDVRGSKVAELINLPYEAGVYEVRIDINDIKVSGGNVIASGIYFYNLTAGGFTQSNKMVIVK